MQLTNAIGGLAGGALIGLSAAACLLFQGEIAGISGFFSATLQGGRNRSFKAAFLIGLVAQGALLSAATPASFGQSRASLGLLVVAGLLVGFGTRLGGGCTSGHGVCGISRGSGRSIVATVVFMATAAVTVFVMLKAGAR